jgi:hypothetical protein
VFCCTKQTGWKAKSRVVMNYKLEHTNKELDERLTSALVFALLLCDRVLHGVAPSKHSRPLLCLHYCSFHLMILLESFPCFLTSHASMIFLLNKALAAPHACTLHVV